MMWKASRPKKEVAPYIGAWIEILNVTNWV
ncbi:Protein of unknown function [Bacillus wiedmannii]|nr:Protein of unknown function [Bacillus wiedmannii]